MFFDGRIRAVAITVLVNYAALLTVGQALHNHGQPAPRDADGHLHSCCAHGEHGGHAHVADAATRATRGTDSDSRRLDQASGPRIYRDDQCLICRFLGQKPIPGKVVRLIHSAPLVATAEPLKPSRPVMRSVSLFDVRGPPVIC